MRSTTATPGGELVGGVRFSGFQAAGSHGVCAAAGEMRWSTSVGVTRGPGELGIWRGYDVTSVLADRAWAWITQRARQSRGRFFHGGPPNLGLP